MTKPLWIGVTSQRATPPARGPPFVRWSSSTTPESDSAMPEASSSAPGFALSEARIGRADLGQLASQPP